MNNFMNLKSVITNSKLYTITYLFAVLINSISNETALADCKISGDPWFMNGGTFNVKQETDNGACGMIYRLGSRDNTKFDTIEITRAPANGNAGANMENFTTWYRAKPGYTGQDSYQIKTCGENNGSKNCFTENVTVTITGNNQAANQKQNNQNNANNIIASNSVKYKNIDDKTICQQALTSDGSLFDTKTMYQDYVKEAKKRGFNEKVCSAILVQDETDKRLCEKSINFTLTAFLENSLYTNEAKKRLLTVDGCISKINETDKLTEKEICEKSIDTNGHFFPYSNINFVREAKFRGYSEERCLKLIGRLKITTSKSEQNYDAFLEQIKFFASKNKPSTDPIIFAVAVDKLRKAVAGTNEAEKQNAYEQLNKILDADQNYIAFKKKKDEEARQADNETLRNLNSDAKMIKAFIADYLNKNPIAEYAADLGEIISALDSEIKNQNVSSFKSAIETIKNQLKQYKLLYNFENYTLENETANNNVASSNDAPPASKTLKLTGKNKILLEGSKDDIVILYNATKDAPNVATNLAGRLTFEKDQAYICWYQAKPSDEEHRRQTLQELNKLGVLKVSDPKLSCEPSTISKYDIIMLERGLFLSSTIDYALPLNDKVEKGEFKLASLLKGEDILSEIQKHETLAQLVETEVEKDLRTGFGIVRIGNDNRVICAAISDKQDGHRKLLSGKTSEISDQLGGRGSILELSMEQAFISAKKNQCGIIYSSASDMKSLYPALKRESIPYKTLPIWFSLKEIEEADKAVKNEQTVALQSEEQTRQKLADEAQLKEASENTAEALRKKKETQLRTTYAVAAKALSDEVGKKILEDVTKVTANNQDNQKPSYLGLFRDLSGWYQKRINEQWELADSRFELYDYGTSRWNDRRIDTIFNKITIKIKNRTIGKYDERCVIIGLVVDKEFEMYREPFESSCDNVENSLENWMKARSFEERWIVRK